MALGGPWLKLYRQYRRNGLSRAEAKKRTEEALGPEPPGTIREENKREDAQKAKAKKRAAEESFVTEVRVCKVLKKLGLVLGYGMVSKVNGEEYFDLQGHHVPEDVLFEASVDFMERSQVAGEMHVEKGEPAVEEVEKGDVVPRGTVVFAFPMTTEVAKAFEVECPVHGLMIAMRPDAEMLAKFESGELTGFSIGGEGLLVPAGEEAA